MSSQIHGHTGGAPEEVTRSVIICYPVQDQTVGSYKDTPFGMIVQFHGLASKRVHVPHFQSHASSVTSPTMTTDMLELRRRFRRRGYEGAKYDEIGYTMLNFCPGGGRRGQEIFDQPKAVRNVPVAFREFTCMANSYLHSPRSPSALFADNSDDLQFQSWPSGTRSPVQSFSRDSV